MEPTMRAVVCCWSASVALLSTSGQAFAQASFIGLGDLPGGDFESAAAAVSPDGRIVVGNSIGAAGREAFRWEAGVMTGLGDLPGGEFSSIARAISADGSVIVGRAASASGSESFRWQDGLMIGLGNLPGGSFDGTANGVSADASVIVGHSSASAGREAYRYADGAMVSLGDLPGGFHSSGAWGVSGDGAVVVGYANSGDLEAFRWEDDVMVGLGFLATPTATDTFQSFAYAISTDGSVIVGSSHNRRVVFDPYSGQFVHAVYYEPFRWENGAMAALLDGTSPGDPPGQPWTFGIATAVNADGSVIVGYGFDAIYWSESTGVRDLAEMLENDFDVDLNGWRLDRAWAVNADGTVIVGYGENPSGNREAWMVTLPAPVPLPSLSPAGGMIAVTLVAITAIGAIRLRARWRASPALR